MQMQSRALFSLCVIAALALSSAKDPNADKSWEESKGEDTWVEKDHPVDPSSASPRRAKAKAKGHATKMIQATASGNCETWVNGQKQLDAKDCGDGKQCITQDMDGSTSSLCDAQSICTGMATKMFEIPTGTCGILPGSGQKVYCSTTTPSGGVMPTGTQCTDVQIGGGPVPTPPAPAPAPETPASPPPAPVSSGPASCGEWAQGMLQKPTTQCESGNTKQCLTSVFGDVTSSNCDWHNVCNGLGDNSYNIANGDCGIVDGRKMYCSTSSPSGGVIPADVVCKDVVMKPAGDYAPSKKEGDTQKGAGHRVEWQVFGLFVTLMAMIATRA